MNIRILAPAALLLTAFLVPTRASAIPAFARKYETSCTTCHTVYPMLNPFGEAFRRNNYRFPGVDSDVVKQGTVPLGQDAYKDLFPNSVWPGSIPNSVPLSLGFNGQITLHPDTNSSGGRADNSTFADFSNLVAEGHVWAGGSFDDTITYFGEITFSRDGTIDIEHARVIFNDLIGPKHAVNLQVGRGFQTLSSFGMHSSYVSDTRMLDAPVAALYGAQGNPWGVLGQYNGIEVNGVVFNDFNYSLGINAGTTTSLTDVRPLENFYGHVGYKIGGMTMDGEDSKADPNEPWAETSVTIDLFFAHSDSWITFAPPAGSMAMIGPNQDKANTYGAGLRGQLGSLMLDSGLYKSDHTHPIMDTSSAFAIVQYNEISYVVFPWLVPAVRFEYVQLNANSDSIHDLKVIPGVAMLLRPNIKLVLSAQIEEADGAPDGGWGAAGGVAVPPDPTNGMNHVKTEIESAMAVFAFAF
jgi:hypothetical protein